MAYIVSDRNVLFSAVAREGFRLSSSRSVPEREITSLNPSVIAVPPLSVYEMAVSLGLACIVNCDAL